MIVQKIELESINAVLEKYVNCSIYGDILYATFKYQYSVHGMKIETDTLCGLFVGWVGFVYLKFFCRFDL